MGTRSISEPPKEISIPAKAGQYKLQTATKYISYFPGSGNEPAYLRLRIDDNRILDVCLTREALSALQEALVRTPPAK